MDKCENCGINLNDDSVVVWKCPECGRAFKVSFSKLHKIQEWKGKNVGKHLIKCSSCGYALDDGNEKIACKCSSCGSVFTGNLAYFVDDQNNIHNDVEINTANSKLDMIECPECGKQILSDSKICSYCGYPLMSEPEVKKNLVRCPECGREISPRAKKCVHCGKMFVETESQSKNDTKARKKKRVVIGVTVLAIVLVAIFLSAISIVWREENSELSINEINISKWKLLDESDYFDDYEGTVNSNETKPFVAVVGCYEETERIPMFVYMEDGKGIIQTYELSGDDPSIKYTAIGYMNGESVKETDVSNIKYNDYDYSDSSYRTSCTVNVEVEMKDNIDGLLFVELSNDLTKDIKKNVAVIIVGGKGKYSYYLSELPLKARGVEVTAIPKFFCSATNLKETDYVVEKPFSVEKNEGKYMTSFSGSEELTFSGYDDGLILYTEELLDGGKKEDRGERIRNVEYLKDNQCIITTYTSGDDDDKILMPVFDIQIVGYLKWDKYIR